MTKKLIKAKQMVQFDEDSLRKWEEMLARKEEDNQLIEDYMKQDTQKYKVYFNNYGTVRNKQKIINWDLMG